MEFTRDNTKIAKGFAIVLMLYHHLFNFPDRLQEGVEFIPVLSVRGYTDASVFGATGNLCVAMFVFLAAYGTYMSCKNTENLTGKLWFKIKHLYCSYWKVFLIFIPIAFALGADTVTSDGVGFINNFFGICITYNMEWWFFTPYVIMMLSYPLIHKWIGRKNGCIFTDVLLLFLYIKIYGYLLPEIMSTPAFREMGATVFWDNTNKYLGMLPVFFTGCLAAKYELFTKYRKAFESHFIMYGMSLILIGVCFFMRLMIRGEYDCIYAPVIIIAFTTIVQDIIGLRFLFRKIGEQSTTIWLVHSFYCYAFIQKFVYSPRYSLLIMLLLLIISFATGVLLDYFYKGIFFVLKKIPFLKLSASHN